MIKYYLFRHISYIFAPVITSKPKGRELNRINLYDDEKTHDITFYNVHHPLRVWERSRNSCPKSDKTFNKNTKAGRHDRSSGRPCVRTNMEVGTKSF